LKDYYQDFSSGELLFSSLKSKAIKSDQYFTSHSIINEVPDTEAAGLSYDTIMLYKGASLIEYLYYLCQEEKFLSGLRLFLNKYKNKNANIENFIAVFKEVLPTTELNTLDIFQTFLNNRGVNRLEYVF
jgi:aminopeptidase N